MSKGGVGQALEELKAQLGVDNVPWGKVVVVLSGGLLAKILWTQYGVLAKSRRPPTMLGWPVLGHTLSVFSETLEHWGDRVMQGRKAVLANFLFQNTVLVSHPVYEEHLARRELDGEFRSEFPPSFQALIGSNSVICLPGGKGHQHHKRLRGKLLHSLAPMPCISVLPEMAAEIRLTLDGLVNDTARDGYATFVPAGSSLAAKVSMLQITAGLEPELQGRVMRLIDEVVGGLFSIPINLGRFSAFGRALKARSELREVVTQLLASPMKDKRNILADLVTATEGGEAFTPEEVLDTILTLLIAGKLTTADALPHLVANLCKYPEWASKVAKEEPQFTAIESDSAALRVVLETLRKDPPVGAYRRVCDNDLDMGEAGVIPAGCQFAHIFRSHLKGMGGTAFEPNRWTQEEVRQTGWLPFGGHQPHSCIGRSLALLELQLFARILCREYEFDVQCYDLIAKASMPLNKTFRDGLRIVIKRKA